MTWRRLALAFGWVGLVLLAAPHAAHAWTPGTHIYLGESILANLHLLPQSVAELLHSYPFDFLYGNMKPRPAPLTTPKQAAQPLTEETAAAVTGSASEPSSS